MTTIDLPTGSEIEVMVSGAIQQFWGIRNAQLGNSNTDQGNRRAVTGGKQLDGFIDLLKSISVNYIGVQPSWIFTSNSVLPGYFRPTKNWDFAIITPANELLSVIELKSQVGSFGNNFNNRTEEALGSAVDLWTAYRENGFDQTTPPWVGYVMIIESNEKSNSIVKTQPSVFRIRDEYLNSSYISRYVSLCRKLVQERHYSVSALIGTNGSNQFSYPDDELSFNRFIQSFVASTRQRLISNNGVR